MPQMEITDREKVWIDFIRKLDDKQKHTVVITLRGREAFKIRDYPEVDIGYAIKQQQLATA